MSRGEGVRVAGKTWGRRISLRLPTLTVLIPSVSLAGLFGSASVEEKLIRGCTSPASLGFCSRSLPMTIAVCVFFLCLWTWMAISLCRHN
ncbi:phosphatidylinositol N-acetylglucosaminyltransferase subunit Y-like [Mirounga angustirostris]|uniref:phosphatidylinositol N-acetylglucosaminyltransferase subunit Y-like n=1 Tax=Mirounga angustirostris TaxID=9716 RepID=UPI00313DA640